MFKPLSSTRFQINRIHASYQYGFLWNSSLKDSTTKHYLYFDLRYHPPGHMTCLFLMLVNLATQCIAIDFVYSSLTPLIIHGNEIQNSLINSNRNLKDLTKRSIQLNLENQNSVWYLFTTPSQKTPKWNLTIRSDHEP